jgi:chemotaxis protein methyltransferase CheR
MDESPNSTGPKMTDETFILLRDFIYEHSGIYFADPKKSQLEARLLMRLKANNLPDFDKYYYMLKYDPRLLES